jgi:hypothetical protein
LTAGTDSRTAAKELTVNTKQCAFVALLVSVFLMATASAASKQEIDAAMQYDGLKQTKVKDIDLAYIRPGATLAGYSSVMLEPVEVAFRKDWDPARAGSRIKISNEDRENIRNGVAKLVYDQFATELQSKSGYKVVTQAGPDVLRVKVHIINLYANAPDTGTMGPSRTYTVSAGEMTLFAELFDSETGQVLARVVDRREGRNSGRMELSSGVGNSAEAASIASGWARILRKGLDQAHSVGKK